MKLRRGFFGFLGNNLEFTSIDRYFWLGVSFIIIFLIMVFKTKIHTWFHKKNRTKGLQIIGAIILIINLTNRILLIVGGYPRYWEIAPLQLCRLAFTLSGIILVFKKIKYLKILAIPTILGSITALVVAKLYSGMQADWVNEGYPSYSQGADNYFYWDNYVTHIFLLASSCFFWTVYRWKFGFRELMSNSSQLGIYTVFSFILNIMLTSIWPKYPADFLYVGETSSFHLPFGVLGDWPYTLISFAFVGYASFILLWLVWIFLGKFDLGQKIFWRKSIHNYNDVGVYNLKVFSIKKIKNKEYA